MLTTADRDPCRGAPSPAAGRTRARPRRPPIGGSLPRIGTRQGGSAATWQRRISSSTTRQAPEGSNSHDRPRRRHAEHDAAGASRRAPASAHVVRHRARPRDGRELLLLQGAHGLAAGALHGGSQGHRLRCQAPDGHRSGRGLPAGPEAVLHHRLRARVAGDPLADVGLHRERALRERAQVRARVLPRVARALRLGPDRRLHAVDPLRHALPHRLERGAGAGCRSSASRATSRPA